MRKRFFFLQNPKEYANLLRIIHGIIVQSPVGFLGIYFHIFYVAHPNGAGILAQAIVSNSDSGNGNPWGWVSGVYCNLPPVSGA